MLAGPPEPEQRKAAQQKGLASLARIERNAAGGDAPSGPQPRLSRLEHARPAAPGRRRSYPPPTPRPSRASSPPSSGSSSSALLAAPSVSAAAAELGMSRSNVYASLRRVGRKLGVSDVSELLRLLRDARRARAMLLERAAAPISPA